MTKQFLMQRDTLIYCIPGDLPWISWALSGAEFKLLHADPQSGRLAPTNRLAGARLRAFP